jgi:spore germination protein KA
VLRIVFILIGGATGLYGIMIGAAALVISLASMTDYAVPFLSPITPFEKTLLRDSIVRISMEKLGKNIFDINSVRK